MAKRGASEEGRLVAQKVKEEMGRVLAGKAKTKTLEEIRRKFGFD